MSGMTIVERLVNRDEDARTLTYAIVDGPVPVDSHEATIAVVPAGDGSTGQLVGDDRARRRRRPS